jgi:zinc transporter ZupT
MPQPSANRIDPRLDPVFVERERNRFAARALAFLVLLNGAAAIVLLSILARAPESSVEPKFAAAMLFFSGGAIAALLSSFLAYMNRTVAMEAPERANLRRVLQILAIIAVIGSAASFLTGMNMVGSAASEKSSSHPKGPKEQQGPKEPHMPAPTAQPSERVELLNNI